MVESLVPISCCNGPIQLLTSDVPMFPQQIGVSVSKSGVGGADAAQFGGALPVQRPGHYGTILDFHQIQTALLTRQLLSAEQMELTWRTRKTVALVKSHYNCYELLNEMRIGKNVSTFQRKVTILSKENISKRYEWSKIFFWVVSLTLIL